MGRPRVPMEKRIIEGTDRASTRRRAEGSVKVPIKTITECPGLSAEAKKHWPLFVKMFSAMPVVAESDIAAVQQLVEAYAEVRAHRATLEKDGRFYKSATREGEIMRPHPALASLLPTVSTLLSATLVRLEDPRDPEDVLPTVDVPAHALASGEIPPRHDDRWRYTMARDRAMTTDLRSFFQQHMRDLEAAVGRERIAQILHLTDPDVMMYLRRPRGGA